MVLDESDDGMRDNRTRRPYDASKVGRLLRSKYIGTLSQ
jgi:hypothetical protein